MAQKPVVPSVVSLVGGLLLVAGSVPVLFVSIGAALGAAVWMAALALATAIVVPAAAVLLYMRPNEHRTWGLVILAFSLLRVVWFPTLFFIFLSGFAAGTIFGVAGGILGFIGGPAQAAAS